jgi:hypothetical protein
MPSRVCESTLESTALDWLEDLCYTILAGDTPARGVPGTEGTTFSSAGAPV